MTFESKLMNINFKDAVSYLTFKELEKYKFMRHAYSTRLGGVSKGNFKSLNFSFNCGDDAKLVEQNYNIFCRCLGIKESMISAAMQVHGDKIACVDSKNLNSFNKTFNCFAETDALITSEPNIVLSTFHADCLAIYMVDIKKRVVGLAHAGWRGTVKSIAVKLAEKFINYYNSRKNDIICALGPCIGPCCFEVSQPALKEFENLDILKNYIFYSNSKDRARIDLREVNKNLLIKFGLDEKNIFKSDVCTMCSKDLLFSHRATNGKRGTSCSLIWILD